MDLRLLRYFLTVAKLQNITRAAEALHITQPALSRQLKELEDSLGTSLLNRGKRKTTLTKQGLLLQVRAEEILDLVDKTEKEIETEASNFVGLIHMGCAETYAMKTITDTLKAIQEKHPKVALRIISSDETHVMNALDKGLLDFGLVVEPSKLKQYEYLQLPYVDSWGILMRFDDPLVKKDSISPEDLYHKPLIISNQAYENKEFIRWWADSENPMNIVSFISLLYNGSLLVRSGVGYLLALDKIITTSPDNELVFRPLYPPLQSHAFLTWKKDRPLSPMSEYFLDSLKKNIIHT